jgi:hypothetical protein
VLPAEAPVLAAISVPMFQLFEDLRRELSSSDELHSCWDDIMARAHGTEWRVQDGLILFKGHVFVPSSSAILDDILQLAHTAAHEGIQKMLQQLHTEFFIEHDCHVVRDLILACTTCQCNKTEALHPAGLLQPLPVPSQVWVDIAMDFIKALLRVHGKSVILTIVDRFSKYAHFIPLATRTRCPLSRAHSSMT